MAADAGCFVLLPGPSGGFGDRKHLAGAGQGTQRVLGGQEVSPVTSLLEGGGERQVWW